MKNIFVFNILILSNLIYANDFPLIGNRKNVKRFYSDPDFAKRFTYTEGYKVLHSYEILGPTTNFHSALYSKKEQVEKVNLVIKNDCKVSNRLELSVSGRETKFTASFKCKDIKLDPNKHFIFVENDEYSLKGGLLKSESRMGFSHIYILRKPSEFYGTDFLFKGQINL